MALGTIPSVLRKSRMGEQWTSGNPASSTMTRATSLLPSVATMGVRNAHFHSISEHHPRVGMVWWKTKLSAGGEGSRPGPSA